MEKTNNIAISSVIKNEMKEYCASEGISMRDFIEELLIEFLEKNNK